MSPGWKKGKVSGLISALESGVSVNGEDRVFHGNEPAVLKVSAVTYGSFDPLASKPIIESELVRAKCTPKAGRIIVSRSNTPDLVGASAYIEQNHNNLFLSDKLWQTVPHKKADFNMRWLAYFLASPHSRFQLSRLATGSSNSMKNISKDELLSLHVDIPPRCEQDEIVGVIATVDQLIEKTEQLISAKEKHYHWLSRKLFFGQANLEKSHKKTRWFTLPDSWQVLHIGDVAKEQKRFNRQKEELPALSCTKHHGLVDSRRYFKKQIFSQDTSTYKVVAENEFVYATNHIEEGSIGHQNLYPQGLVSPMYTVFKTNDKIVDGYLFKLLKTETYRHIFEVHTSSSVARRRSLRWKEFTKLPIPVPSIEEQQKIDEILSLAKSEITLLKKQAALYRKQKHGFMQKLLTGEWRINV